MSDDAPAEAVADELAVRRANAAAHTAEGVDCGGPDHCTACTMTSSILERTQELYKEACVERGYGSSENLSDQIKSLARAVAELIADILEASEDE